MKPNSKVTVSAVASAVSLALGAAAQAQTHPERPTYKYEKCYGIAKAGQNDCFSASNACGGTSAEDGQKDAWIYVPDGTCKKVVGGILDKKAANEEKKDKKSKPDQKE